MFGVTSSFGLLSMLGYDGCNLIFVIPFLVIGIGIDDMFIIYATYLSCYRHKLQQGDTATTTRGVGEAEPLRGRQTATKTCDDGRQDDLDEEETRVINELMSKTLAKSGVSITITSLTDFVAFLVGLTTNFKSVQIFCVYAGFAIAFCYIYQITFFCGFLCLHIKRILNKRNAYFFCFKLVIAQYNYHDYPYLIIIN